MPNGGIDTSIYAESANAGPFDYQNKLLDFQQKQQAVQQNQIKLATERFGIINNAASGLMGDPDFEKKDANGNLVDLTPRLWEALGRATKGDAMTAQHAVQFAQQFPDASTPQGALQQRERIKAVYAQTLDAWQKGQAYLGQTTPLSTGGGTKFVQTPAFSGAPPQDRGYVPNTLQPSTTQVNPDLSQSYVGGTGNPAIQGPSTPVARSAVGPAAAGQAGQAVPPGATPLAAARPGQAAAAEVTGGGAGKALSDARDRSLNYQQEVNPLEQAIPALEKLGTKGSGPGTESINHLKSFVLSNVPGADFKGLKDDVATYDKAKKYLTDWVNQNGNSGTNDKLAAAFAGNPSVNISNAAAADVAKTALALRRFKEAQLRAFESSGKPEADFAKEAGKFAREHDPRAYGFDMMTPAVRTKLLDSLPKGKRELFMFDVDDAHESGLIHSPKKPS